MTPAMRWLFGITASGAALFVHLLPAPSERHEPAATAARLVHERSAAAPEGRAAAPEDAPVPPAEGQIASRVPPAPPPPPGAPAVFGGSAPGPILPADGHAPPRLRSGPPAQAVTDATAVR